jgi:mono/diheme cytochrome c family protein
MGDDEAIYAQDLAEWEKKTGVKIESGDCVLLRTGRWKRVKEKGPLDLNRQAPGLYASAGRWLKDRDIALLGSDVVQDVRPSRVEGVNQPIHQMFLVAVGTPLFDNCDLEAAADVAARLHRSTFMMTVGRCVCREQPVRRLTHWRSFDKSMPRNNSGTRGDSRVSLIPVLVLSAVAILSVSAAPDTSPNPTLQLYAQRCSVCHGADAGGTDRGPALTGNRRLRARPVAEIAGAIKNGTPGGMPAFPLPEDQLSPLADYVRSLNATAFEAKPAGDQAAASASSSARANAIPAIR